MCAGMIFRFGEQKLNDFSAGEAKIDHGKQSRQSNSKYNFVQYVFFEKGNMQSTMHSWGIFENFSVKCNLTVCRVTFNCKLQVTKNWGSRMY